MPDRAKLRIVIFARTPAPGRVKTRLVGPLTAVQAAALHEAMVRDTAETAAAAPLNAERVLLFDGRWSGTPLPAGIRTGRQAAGSLGDRLHAAFTEAFAGGARAAIALGSDTPHLPPARLVEAAAALENHDAVVGPCEDGGYYLIGCRAGTAWTKLFDGVAWGTARVLEQTRVAARQAEVSLAELEPWYDLDRWDDVTRLAAEGAGAPLTRATLAHFRVQGSKFKVQS